VPYGGGNTFYENNCSSCHGIGREGFYENEFIGDKYVPSLVGIKIKNQNQSSYKYLKKIHNNVDIIFDFDEQYLLDSLSNFEKYDNFLNKFKLLKINGFWQNLLDKEGLPATNYPWGGIAKINMDNGNLVWKIPFGKRYNKNKELISIGDKNFGGVLSTSSDLIFATGTPDEKGRAFSSKDGKLLWETKLPYAGSSPPMTYTYLGCQYIIFTATGGQFVGFKEKGDATVAYKLNDCQN
jgi:quinoprotein glucose dehydrogenase